MNVTFLVHDLQVYLTVHNKVNILAILLESEDLVSFLIDHFLHMILDSHKELMTVVVRVKIVNLFKQFDLELDPLVIVLQSVLLNVVEGIRTVGPQFDEVIFPQVS